MQRPPWACTSCVHLIRDNVDGVERTCKAFPDEIPMEIWSGDNDHTQPFAGDQGIRYQKITSEDLTASAAFHLAGQHDQSTHGRGGISGDAAYKSAPISIGDVVNTNPHVDDPRGIRHAARPGDITEMSQVEFNAVNEVRGSTWGTGVQAHLRGGPRKLSATERAGAEQAVGHIDSVMSRSRLPQDVMLYHGSETAHWLPRGGRGDLTGTEWIDHGYGSATAQFKGHPTAITHEGTKPIHTVHMAIHVPAGTGAIGAYDTAQVMLLERGLRYRVTADHGVIDGIRHLDVDVIK